MTMIIRIKEKHTTATVATNKIRNISTNNGSSNGVITIKAMINTISQINIIIKQEILKIMVVKTKTGKKI